MSTENIQKIVKGASYASLLLSDSGLPITAANINTLLKAAKIQNSELAAKTFEDFLKVNPISKYIGAIGGGSSAPAPAAAASAPAKKEEPKKEEPKEEEADMDMGDLFG